MKNLPRTYQRDIHQFSSKKQAFDMSTDELHQELTLRLSNEKRRPLELTSQEKVIHELELHQIELEIQNRELIESQKLLQASHQKYVDLYDSAPVGYLTLDPMGKILEVNLTAATIIQLEKTLILQKSFSRFLSKESRIKFMNHLHEFAHLKAHDTLLCELELSNSDAPVQVQLHTRVIQNQKQQTVFLVAMIDLTAQKRVEAAEKLAETLIQEKSIRARYVETLSHDLLGPVTSSKLCAQMLSRTIEDGEKKTKLYKIMTDELDRADQMIKDLLDASRINGNRELPLIKKRCDLDYILRKFVNDFSTLHGGAVRIEYKVHGEAIGYWSKDGLTRIIENLVNNAVKYGDTQSPISIFLEDQSEMVSLTVHNFGTPISPKDQTKIFDAFQRSSQAEEGQSSGWGLGLDLVSSLVKRHGGVVSLKSNRTDGTFFTVTMPKRHTSG